ncbi:unnamed protein product [Nippostrongylus brasiliensis]|uniref:ANF_receptor domain-containing protein n=1 Tax=Nippostrongylus brasiliensis TaxID=27835 RepID=A0A0N4XZM0_NIPBR|nr:unnamed protein product [Nippostrongylus brasiliensis]
MSAFWLGGVPVFTTSGLVDELGDRKEFPLLTRMMGTYRTLGNLMYEIAKLQSWKHFYFVFNDEAGIEGGKGLPRSECYFSLNAIRNRIQKEIIWHVDMFSTRNATRKKYSDLLKKVSMSSNITIAYPCIPWKKTRSGRVKPLNNLVTHLSAVDASRRREASAISLAFVAQEERQFRFPLNVD